MYLHFHCSVQSLSHVQLLATPWTAARQASLSITNSRSSLKPMSPEPPALAGRFFTTEPPVSSVQLLSHVQLFATPWTAAHQASLSFTISRSLLMSMESVMSSNHLILCCPLLLLPPVPPRIRVFSNESTLHIRWPKYWSFSLSISPSNLTSY